MQGQSLLPALGGSLRLNVNALGCSFLWSMLSRLRTHQGRTEAHQSTRVQMPVTACLCKFARLQAYLANDHRPAAPSPSNPPSSLCGHALWTCLDVNSPMPSIGDGCHSTAPTSSPSPSSVWSFLCRWCPLLSLVGNTCMWRLRWCSHKHQPTNDAADAGPWCMHKHQIRSDAFWCRALARALVHH